MSTDIVDYDDSKGSVVRIEGIFTDNNGSVQTTFSLDTDDKKQLVFNSLADSEPIADHLNEVFELKDAIAQTVTITDKVTGEQTERISIIFITGEGKLYRAVSNGLVRDIGRLFRAFGLPSTWDAPRYVKIVQLSVGGNRVYNLRLATAPKK